jgi:YbbR domain-containing protein
VPVNLIALDAAVQVIDFQPRQAQVQIDPVQEREMPVTVTLDTVPDTITVGPPQVDPSTVLVRGASSRVGSVSAVVARVPIDASALNVDREIDLVAVDANGNQVPNVTIDPERARVRIAVAQELATRTLPVAPQLVGEPAPGYRVASVTVEPLVVTVNGEASLVSTLENAPTEPIDLSGRSTDLETTVPVAVPEGVTVSGNDQIRVVLTFAPVEGTQTFVVGVTLDGARSDYTYALATSQVNVTLGGSIADLDAVTASTLTAVGQVAGLEPGNHVVSVSVTAMPGIDVVEIVPAQVAVTVNGPSPSPTSVAQPSP